MAEAKPDVSKKTLAALEQVLDAISEPSSRRRFLKNPSSVLKQESALPQPVIDALAELTPAELRLVADLNATLIDAGLRLPDIRVGLV
jgi:hypothetical protein